jgi:hypothetical protein
MHKTRWMRGSRRSIVFSLSRARTTAIAVWTFGMASLLYACGSGSKSSARLDIAPPVASDEETDDEWLRQQERLTIRFTASGEEPTEKDATIAEGIERIRQYCWNQIPSGECLARYTDDVGEQLCIARTTLAVSTAQSTPVTLTWDGGSPYCGGGSPWPCGLINTVVFDRITEANAAEFAALAVDYARLALDTALKMIEDPASGCHFLGGYNWTQTTLRAPPTIERLKQTWLCRMPRAPVARPLHRPHVAPSSSKNSLGRQPHISW